MPYVKIPGASQESGLKVGWSKYAEYVQVAVTSKDRFIFVNELEDKSPVECDELYFHFSNRGQINDVIRALRKARNDAFGRDE